MFLKFEGVVSQFKPELYHKNNMTRKKRLSCPKCGTSIRLIDILLNIESIFSKNSKRWKCSNCDEVLTVSQKSKINLIIIFSLIFFLLLFSDDLARLTSNLLFGIYESLISLLLFFFAIFILIRYIRVQIVLFSDLNNSLPNNNLIKKNKKYIFKEFIRGVKLIDSNCIKINSILGLILLISGLINSFPVIKEEPPLLFNPIIELQLILGIIFSICYILYKFNKLYVNTILLFQGFIFIILVIFYSIFMLHITQRIIHGTIELGGIAHPPGILALGMAYGIRQIVDFSFLRNKLKIYSIKLITISAIFIGGVFDLIILYFMFIILKMKF